MAGSVSKDDEASPAPDGSDDAAGELRDRGGRQARPRRSPVVSFLRETAVVLGSALVISLVIKTFFAQAFYIPSVSMEDTLEVGDRIVVNKLVPGPFDIERGDVVVFVDPGGWLNAGAAPDPNAVEQVLTWVGLLPQHAGEHLVKRVIGLPGDHVVCCDDEGRITVDDVPLDETYLPEGTDPSTLDFDVTVPEDRIWVMGDNRGFSQDSRYHQDLPGGGTVSMDLVVGRAVLLFWPLDRFGTLSNHPETFADVPAAAP